MNAPTLFTDNVSFDSMVLRWLVLEKEAPVEIIRGVMPEENPAPPYYIERDLHLFDHWTIVQFLQERYPADVFMPIDPVTRAQIRQVCVLLRDWDANTEAELEELLGAYPYILGHNFTLADIYAGTRVQQGLVKQTPRVEAYVTQLLAQHKFQEAK